VQENCCNLTVLTYWAL